MVKSEFGKGLVYCLGLFLGHEAQITDFIKLYKKMGDESGAYKIWFYGAADHFFELEVPDKWLRKEKLYNFLNRYLVESWFGKYITLVLKLAPTYPTPTAHDYFGLNGLKKYKVLNNRVRVLRSKALIWRLPRLEKDNPTKEDFIWAIKEAKSLLMSVDKNLGIKVVKGENE